MHFKRQKREAFIFSLSLSPSFRLLSPSIPPAPTQAASQLRPRVVSLAAGKKDPGYEVGYELLTALSKDLLQACSCKHMKLVDKL